MYHIQVYVLHIYYVDILSVLLIILHRRYFKISVVLFKFEGICHFWSGALQPEEAAHERVYGKKSIRKDTSACLEYGHHPRSAQSDIARSMPVMRAPPRYSMPSRGGCPSMSVRQNVTPQHARESTIGTFRRGVVPPTMPMFPWSSTANRGKTRHPP